MKMKNNESEEMYLKTIYILKSENNIVKSIDVANKLNFSKSSVSHGLNLLSNNGYIYFDDFKNIVLTKLGRSYAEKILEKHQLIKDLLISIGANEIVAEDDACKIEHVISDEIYELLKLNSKK